MPMRHGTPDPRASIQFFFFTALYFVLVGIALPGASLHLETFRHNLRMLVAVHAFTMGITILEMGAFYQLVPVLLEQPPADRRQGVAQAWAMGLGALLMVVGFHRWSLPLLWAGGSLVVLSVGWFLLLLGPGVLRARGQGLTPAYLIGAMASLLLVVTLGLTMAFNLQFNFLSGGGWSQLGAHVAIGIGGWFGLSIIGLSYRMAAMFYLTTRSNPPRWAQGLAWLAVAAVAGLGVPLLLGVTTVAPPLAGLAAVLGLVYALDFGRRLHKRKRRAVDVTIVHLFSGLTALTIALIGLLAGAAGWRPGPGAWTALVALLLFGWVGNFAIGLSYKIMPFLIWYQRFAPVAGTRPVPTLAQLTPRRLPWLGLAAWNTGLALLAILALTGAPPVWKVAAGATTGAGALSFAASAIRILTRR